MLILRNGINVLAKRVKNKYFQIVEREKDVSQTWTSQKKKKNKLSAQRKYSIRESKITAYKVRINVNVFVYIRC